MQYYKRTITRREPINKYGKLGYVEYDEYVKTNDIEKFNKGKRIWFMKLSERPHILLHAKKDVVYEVEHELTSSQAYFRKSVSKYRR